MHLPPFKLDHWLSKHSFATPPIAYDLVLAGIAAASVLVWLVALLTLVPRGAGTATAA